MIPITRIVRVEENFQYGTFGTFLINAEVFCVTLEPADLLNRSDVSCIPEQQYICRRVISPSHGETFEVMNVPAREHILFHSGNLKKHTHGCIITAQHFGKLKVADAEARAVLNSGATFKKFMEFMKDYDSFHLTVTSHY